MPKRIITPFANSGDKNTVPDTAPGSDNGFANYPNGFPPSNSIDPALGGYYVKRADFNGVLNDVTSILRDSAKGLLYTHDATYSTAIGGYPANAILSSLTGGLWLNILGSANTSNPDTGGAGWLLIKKGQLIGAQIFNIVGTAIYTPTAGTDSVIVEGVGGGGGGGGTPVTNASQNSAGGGAGGGAYGKTRLTSGFSGVTVTVGAGGTSSAGGAGTGGGTSSFGAFMSMTGGTQGTAGSASAPPWVSSSHGIGGTSTGGNIANISGGNGTAGKLFAGGSLLTGAGGDSAFGRGGYEFNNTGAGVAGNGYGAGGGGAGSYASQGAGAAGGAGSAGLIIVWEYS